MSKIFIATVSVAVATLTLQPQVKADTLALWTFESITFSSGITNSTSLFSVSPEVGSGTASSVHAGATTFTGPAGNGSVRSISANTWAVNDYWQFQVSTIGFSGIGVAFDQTSSGTGPRDFALRYSTDGSSFTTFANYVVLGNGTSPNPSWNTSTSSSAYSYLFDLSSITAINNASTVYFRLVDTSTTSAGGGTVGTGGTDRMDNFHVFSPIPEPTSAALGGLGLLSMLVLRRRK